MKISKEVARIIIGGAFGFFLSIFGLPFYLPFYTLGYWVIFGLFILTLFNENRND